MLSLPLQSHRSVSGKGTWRWPCRQHCNTASFTVLIKNQTNNCRYFFQGSFFFSFPNMWQTLCLPKKQAFLLICNGHGIFLPTHFSSNHSQHLYENRISQPLCYSFSPGPLDAFSQSLQQESCSLCREESINYAMTGL